MLSLKITIWAIIFVITNGAVFADYFKDNKILSALAGLFAVISSYYLFGDIEKDIEHISGYKFLLYIVVGVIIVFTIIHALKSEEQSEQRGSFGYLFTVLFLGVVVFGGLYLLDASSEAKDFEQEKVIVKKKPHQTDFKVNKNSFENIPILENIPKKDTFETKANYDAKINEIMKHYNNKLQEISFLAGKAKMIGYDAESKVAQIQIEFKDSLGLTNYTKKLPLNSNIAKEVFHDINGKINFYVRLYATYKKEFFILQTYIENEENKYLLFANPKIIYSLNGITTINGLMYQNNHKFRKKYSWQKGIKYCENLSLGGYNNWRLPLEEELKKLLTKNKHKNSEGDSYFIKKEFVENMDSKDYFWSSEVYAHFWTSEIKDSLSSFLVSFNDGYDYWNDKTLNYYVLCVQ